MDAARSGKTMQYERTPWIPGSIFYADASDYAPLCYRKDERRREEKVPHYEIRRIFSVHLDSTSRSQVRLAGMTGYMDCFATLAMTHVSVIASLSLSKTWRSMIQLRKTETGF